MKNKFLIFFIIIFLMISSNIFSDVICIDPGHGRKSNGTNTGAPGLNGSLDPWEDDINLELAWAFENSLYLLYDPNDIYVTRIDEWRLEDPLYDDLLARLNIAHGYRADGYGNYIFPPLSCDEFVSVHCNASYNSSAQGSSCFIHDQHASSGNWNHPAQDMTDSYFLANYILDALIYETTPVFSYAGYAYGDPGSIVGTKDDFMILDDSFVPSTVIVETEYVSNSISWTVLTDWFFNNDWTYINSAGDGIALGCSYYSPIINSIEPEKPVIALIKFHLYENYPNPFNPTTTIKYYIERASDVELQIFNSAGQLIRTLTKDHKFSGFYSTVWDGTNNNGLSVASGTYICRLRAGEYNKSIKLALIR